MPGTLDSQVWTWTNSGKGSRQAKPGVLEIGDNGDNIIEVVDDDNEVEYEGGILVSLPAHHHNTPECSPPPTELPSPPFPGVQPPATLVNYDRRGR